MSKFNLGIVKTSILANMNESSSLKGFVNLLKESEILKIVLSIFENIEKKHIPNEDLAIKYIDENINLLRGKCTKEIFESENRKFLPLVETVQFSSTSKKTLYENIHTLLYESLSGKKATNVNKLHDSFVYVLEHIKNNDKKSVVESIELPLIPKEIAVSDFFLKKAIFEFNEKYNEILTEDEITILKSVVNENTISKETSFTTIKEGTLNSLKELKSELESQDKVNMNVNEKREIDQFIYRIDESISNIQKLSFTNETFMNDAIGLIDLKKELGS